MIAGYVDEPSVAVDPKKGLMGTRAAAAAAAIFVVAVVEDAALKGFAAKYFALAESVRG